VVVAGPDTGSGSIMGRCEVGAVGAARVAGTVSGSRARARACASAVGVFETFVQSTYLYSCSRFQSIATNCVHWSTCNDKGDLNRGKVNKAV
jgi:hypothetical protein